jgi:hypothetical protein
VATSPLVPKALRNEAGKPLKTTKGVPFPQYDYPGSKISPFTGKPYTKAEAKDVHDKTHARNLRIQKGQKLERPGNAKKPPPRGSVWQRFVASGHQVGPKKGSVWGNHVAANKKKGGTPLLPDDFLGHKSRQAKYAENKKKSLGTKSDPKKDALSAAAKRAIARNSSRRT